MFTGIVEAVGLVTAVDDRDGGRVMTISAPAITTDLPIGASIAVNGACLTAVVVESTTFRSELVAETLSRTNLGQVKTNDRVNLERAMPASGRFDGHIVQGHVDGIGEIEAIEVEPMGVRMEIRPPDALGPYLVEKGSVTVDGVSLTIAGLTAGGFAVALIPHTLEVTTLGERQVGDQVNLEVDILAKYMERLLRLSR